MAKRILQRRVLAPATLQETFVPLSCMICHDPVDLLTAHYGRVKIGTLKVTRDVARVADLGTGQDHLENPQPVRDFFTEAGVSAITLYAASIERQFKIPKKITGFACESCFLPLHNDTWRNKEGHLRRAFETLRLPDQTAKETIPAGKGKTKQHTYIVGGTSEPVFSEAPPITKGLYAPHAGGAKSSPVLEESQIKNEHLKGFSRGRRPRQSKVKVLLRKGKVPVKRRGGVKLPDTVSTAVPTEPSK